MARKPQSISSQAAILNSSNVCPSPLIPFQTPVEARLFEGILTSTHPAQRHLTGVRLLAAEMASALAICARCREALADAGSDFIQTEKGLVAHPAHTLLASAQQRVASLAVRLKIGVTADVRETARAMTFEGASVPLQLVTEPSGPAPDWVSMAKKLPKAK